MAKNKTGIRILRLDNKTKPGLMVCALLLSLAVQAGDTLEAIMARMTTAQATRIRYQEVRTMALFDRPWRGSGFLYSLPPDVLLKEQIHPYRELMGVVGQRMYYYQPGQQIRQQAELRVDDTFSLHVAAFKALLNGDKNSLQRFYRIDVSNDAGFWHVLLTPRTEAGKKILLKIEVSGPPDQLADEIRVLQTDGDKTVYSLDKAVRNPYITDAITQLKQELFGQ